MPTPEQIKKLLKPPKRQVVTAADYLSSGSTLLNLGCSGRTNGAFIKGHYYYFVGDTSSGKTWLTLTCFAEACQNSNFDGYRLIHDDPENGAIMDWVRFFGKKTARRVEPPAVDKRGHPIYSTTVEDFYFHLDDVVDVGKPVIYVLDSMDSLTSTDEQELLSRQKVAHRKGKEMPASYGTEKAKRNSSGLRQFLPFMRKTGSILVLISQTRQAIERFTRQNKTRSGGNALSFYATLEMWTAQAGHIIRKGTNGARREMGIYSQVRVKKNRINGKDRTVIVPIYHSYGIDDIGGCIDFLLQEGHWKKSKGIINAKDFETELSREKLANHIEENDLQRELQLLVAEVWAEIEKECEISRKPRYE